MKKVLLIILALVVVGGGITVFAMNRDKDKNDSATETIVSEEGVAFNPVSTEGLAVVATVTTQHAGQEVIGVISFDGQGNSEYVTEHEGQQIRSVITADAYYTCTNEECYRMSLGEAGADVTNIDPAQYEFSETDVAILRETIRYEGQQPCASGTCDVWVTDDYEGLGQTKLYIDTNTRRITRIETTHEGLTSSIEYEYRDSVVITIPTNAQEF